MRGAVSVRLGQTGPPLHLPQRGWGHAFQVSCHEVGGTPRWSKADSNSESHPRATPPAATRFVADWLLEQSGFEPSVPLLRKGPRGVAEGSPRNDQPSPEIKAQVLSRDGDACGRLSAAVPFTTGPRFRFSFAPAASRCRRGSAVNSGAGVVYRTEPLSPRTIDPVVCVRYVTQAIIALATSSASTARFNGDAAAAAAIISSVRPGTKPVWTIPGAMTITRISGASTRASAMLIVSSAAFEAP